MALSSYFTTGYGQLILRLPRHHRHLRPHPLMDCAAVHDLAGIARDPRVFGAGRSSPVSNSPGRTALCRTISAFTHCTVSPTATTSSFA